MTTPIWELRGHHAGEAAMKTATYDRGQFYYPKNLYTTKGDSGTEQTYEEWCTSLESAGCNLVRLKMTGRNNDDNVGCAALEPPPYGTFNIWHTALDPSNLTTYRSDQVTHPVNSTTWAASNLGELCVAAQNHGIKFALAPFERQEIKGDWVRHPWNEANEYFDGTPCEAVDQGFLTNAREMFTDATAIQCAKDRIQFLIDTVEPYGVIGYWEMFAELTYICSDKDFWDELAWGSEMRAHIRDEMVPWVEEIAEYIHNNSAAPVASGQARLDHPLGPWDPNPNNLYNAVNEIHQVDGIDLVLMNWYYDGDLDDIITALRLCQEKFTAPVYVEQYWPFAHGVVPADEDAPYLVSKQYEWTLVCGSPGLVGPVRWPGIEESAVNTWTTGGYADTDLHSISGITKAFADYADWSEWDDDTDEDFESYVSAAGITRHVAWGDGEHVVMMIDFDSSGSKTITVSNLINNDTHTVRIFNWVSGALIDTQEPSASDNSLSFTYNVTTYDNVLIVYLVYDAEIPPPPPPPAVSATRNLDIAAYKLRLYTPAGVLVAELTDFWGLSYTKRVNRVGMLTFELDVDHAAIPLLSNRSQVEVHRRNRAQGIDWHCDFYGLYLDQGRAYTDRGIFTANCPSQLWFLSTRIVAWYAATADRAAFTSDPAETIMKTLVDYNACANATTGNSRLRDGAITGLSIQADGANGNTLNWNCAYKNLLTELQDLTLVAGGDFDLIKTAAQAWQFRWYTGQRGTDRSATVIFALERGNMSNPRYRYGRIGEKTVAVVGGQNEESNRDIVIRTGADHGADNDIEVFVEATSHSTTAGYNAVGDKRLDELQIREVLNFSVVQTPACLYGEVASGGDYELGDLVKARAFDIEDTHKFTAVTVTLDPGGNETIDLETETQ